MSSAPALGKLGRFRLLGELGRGAMGVVYRAEDTTLGRPVAIKTIALGGASAEERDLHEARFLQEGRAAGRISHPGIVTIYEMGREGDVAYMAMELLDGVDLRELIRGARLAPSQAVTIAASVAEALAHAHEQHVVHRDIKPGNIMVLGDGRVKIMDFGIARLQEASVRTQTGVLLGSPQYMAPEQIVGRPFDHRADVFSLGLVLYEMLTGARPFAGGDLSELAFKVANSAATPPSHVNPRLPAVLDFIVARALKKNPEERYGTAAELAADLRAALAEVQAAEAASLERGDAPTVAIAQPDLNLAASAGRALRLDEPIALRASPRFDSSRCLARIGVLPAQADLAHTHAGWSVPPRPRPRMDRARVAIVLLYAIALVIAANIAFG